MRRCSMALLVLGLLYVFSMELAYVLVERSAEITLKRHRRRHYE